MPPGSRSSSSYDLTLTRTRTRTDASINSISLPVVHSPHVKPSGRAKSKSAKSKGKSKAVVSSSQVERQVQVALSRSQSRATVASMHQPKGVYVTYKERGGFATWRRKWIILEHGYLKIKLSPVASKSQLDIPLSETTKLEHTSIRPCCLLLRVQGRTFYFSFQDEAIMEEWRGALEERRRPRSRAAPGGGRGAVPWGLEDKLHVEEDGQGDGFTGLPDGWPASAAHRSGPHPDVPQDVVVEPAQAQTPTRIPSIPTTAIRRVSTNASSTTGPIREERLSGGASSQAQLTMSSASTDDLKGGEDRVLLEGQFKVKELGGWARWLWFSKYLTLTPRTLTVSKRAGGSAQRQMSLHAVIHVTRVENKKCCLLVDVAIGRPLLISFESDRELYAWQDAIYDHSLTSGVGMPTNFVHNIHVGFDPVNGAFTGLPDHWNKLLKTNALVPEEHVRRSQVISQEQAKHLTQSINNHSLSKSRSSAVHDQEAAEPSSVVNSTSTSSSNSSSHVRRRTTVRSGVEMVNTDTLLSTSSTLINH